MSVDKAEIQEDLMRHLSKRYLAEGVSIGLDQPFAELGIDSLTVMELVMHIEDRFKISVPVDRLTEEDLRSVRSLVACAVAKQIE